MKRRVFHAQCTRSQDWWTVVITNQPGAVTQVKRLDQVEAMVRDMLSLLLEIPADSFDVQVEPLWDQGLADALEQVSSSAQQAQESAEKAAATKRRAAAMLVNKGFSFRDTATALGLSVARIQQLLHEHHQRTA